MAAKKKQTRRKKKSPPWTKPKGEGTRRPKKKRATKVQQRTVQAAGGDTLWGKAVAAATPGTRDGLVRLNVYMARCGVASRRGSDTLIEQGRVSVNGQTTTSLGQKVDPLRDRILVDEAVLKPEKPVYVLLNKPPGVVCTNSTREQKQRAIDLVERVRARLFPVGRLDVDSEGLLLLTNDGAFAERMMHPRYGVPKVYDVVLRGRIESERLHKARGGVWLAEGRTGGAKIRVKRRGRERTYLEVSIREGRNREIRRVFARLGHPVLKLKRVRIGSLTIRGLGRGKHRMLSKREIDGLLAAAAPIQ